MLGAIFSKKFLDLWSLRIFWTAAKVNKCFLGKFIGILKIFRETPKTAKIFQADRNWQSQFKLFKKLKSSTIFAFSFWAIEPILKEGNDGKFRKISFQWHINEWIAVFIGLKRSFKWRISKMVHLGKKIFSAN